MFASHRRPAPAALAAGLLLAVAPVVRGDGLAAVAHLDGAARVGGALRFRLAITNAGPEAVELGHPAGLFGWLVVTPDRQNAYFSARIPLAPAARHWPERLAAGSAIALTPVAAGTVQVHPYDPRLRLVDGYPATNSVALSAAGNLSDILTPGPAKARWLVAVPGTNNLPRLAKAATTTLTVTPPDFAALAPASRAAYLKDLLARFDRDAWAAQQAHDEAVRHGAAIVPDIAAAACDRERPSHARLWLVTSLADIRDERSVAALLALLPDPAVRSVIGYHGPKQASDRLDAAILEAVRTAGDSRFTAYTLLGYLVTRGQASDELLRLGLESKDPKVRASTARALAGMASDQNKARLRSLAQDPDSRVQAVARQVLEAMEPKAAEKEP